MVEILMVALSDAVRPRGVERHCIELIRRLSTFPGIRISLVIGLWQDYLKDIDGIEYIFYSGNNSKLARHYFVATKIPLLAKKYDCVHYMNSMPVIFKGPQRSMITIHDLAEFKLAGKYPLAQRIYRRIVVRMAVKNVDRILTVSKTSAADLVAVLDLPEAKIKFFYNGVNHMRRRSDLREFQENEKTYICYFGPIEQAKGIEQLLAAYQEMRMKNGPNFNVPLKIAGLVTNGFRKKFEEIISVVAGVEYVGYLKAEDVEPFISRAKVVVYPALYEGFGLPILEALLYNDNIVCSCTGALGEIGADFCWLTDPNDCLSFAETLNKAYSSPHRFTNQFRESILNRFDWDASARGLRDVYLDRR